MIKKKKLLKELLPYLLIKKSCSNDIQVIPILYILLFNFLTVVQEYGDCGLKWRSTAENFVFFLLHEVQ